MLQLGSGNITFAHEVLCGTKITIVLMKSFVFPKMKLVDLSARPKVLLEILVIDDLIKC